MIHALVIVAKVGTREISVSLWIILTTAEDIIENFTKISLILLTIKSLNFKQPQRI